MSLVENIVSQIAAKGFGGVTKPQGFDLNDDTFEKILQSMNTGNAALNDKLQPLGNLGQPSGMIIEPLNEISAVEPIGQDAQNVVAEPVQIKDVDMGNNYFSDLLKDAPKEHKSILNVAQKHAAFAYNLFGKNLVENLTDFAQDVKSMI